MVFQELDLKILKSLISNKKQAIDFANECDTKLFSPDLWNCSALIVNYIKAYKEVPTLNVLLDKLAKLNNDKIIDHVKSVWTELDKTTINDSEYKYNLDKIKQRFAEKQISIMKDSLSKYEPGMTDISKTIKEMQASIQVVKNLDQVKAYERKTLKEAIPLFKEEYQARMNNPEFDTGIKTGYSYLDSTTDGFRPGELILIGAESGGGKSMLLMNMALQMWMQKNTIYTDSDWSAGHSVLYFSLEMPYKPCFNRVLSRLSGCQSKAIRNSKVPKDEVHKLKQTLSFIKRYPYEFEIVDIPRNATIESLESIYEEVKPLYDPKIVVVDYLGLMGYSGNGKEMDDWLKLGKISEVLHEMARVHNLIILSAVQLNRVKPSKETEEKIGLHRVGRSALILQNANIAIQIETRQNEKQYPDMAYHVIKNRDGELGRGRIIKNLASATLVDDKDPSQEEDDTEFHMRDPDDISDRLTDVDL